jgi:hypothetical protein
MITIHSSASRRRHGSLSAQHSSAQRSLAHWKSFAHTMPDDIEAPNALRFVTCRAARTTYAADREAPVTSDSQRKIEDVAADLDDLKTTVEELEIDAAVQSNKPELRRIKQALDEASDATDALDDNVDQRKNKPPL